MLLRLDETEACVLDNETDICAYSERTQCDRVGAEKRARVFVLCWEKDRNKLHREMVSSTVLPVRVFPSHHPLSLCLPDVVAVPPSHGPLSQEGYKARIPNVLVSMKKYLVENGGLKVVSARAWSDFKGEHLAGCFDQF